MYIQEKLSNMYMYLVLESSYGNMFTAGVRELHLSTIREQPGREGRLTRTTIQS